MNKTNYLLAILSEKVLTEKSANLKQSIINGIANFFKGTAQPLLKARGTTQQVVGRALQAVPGKSIPAVGKTIMDKGTQLVNENAIGNVFATGNKMPLAQRLGRLTGSATVGLPLAPASWGVSNYLTTKYAPLSEQAANEAIAKGEREQLGKYVGAVNPSMISGLFGGAGQRQQLIETIGENNPNMRNAMSLSNIVPYNLQQNAGTANPVFNRDLIKKTDGFINPYLNTWSLLPFLKKETMRDWAQDTANQKLKDMTTQKSGSVLSKFFKYLVSGKTTPNAAMTYAGLGALGGAANALSQREEALRNIGRGRVDAGVYNALQSTNTPASRDFLKSLMPSTLAPGQANNIINQYKALVPSIPFKPKVLNTATNTNADFTKLDPNAGQKPNFSLGNQ